MFLQQGDVIIQKAKLPTGIKKIDTNILQEGEHTGHAHRLWGNGYTVFENPSTKQKYLKIVKPVALRHEEHKEFNIPAGDYEIRIVREYDHFEEEMRNVMD